MEDLHAIVLRSLEQAMSHKLNSLDGARLIVRRVEQSDSISVINRSTLERLHEQRNQLKGLNNLLVKIVRDMFPHKSCEVLEKIMRVGLVYSPDGLRQMSAHWSDFYRSQVHLQTMQSIAKCMLLGFQQQLSATSRGMDVLKQIRSKPQNVCNLDFLEIVGSVLQDAQKHASPRQTAAREYVKRLETQGIQAAPDRYETIDEEYLEKEYEKGSALSYFESLYSTAPSTQDPAQPSLQVGAKCDLFVGMDAKKGALQLARGVKADIFKDIGDFLLKDIENKQRLCVLKVKNMNELVEVFGSDGYSRAIASIKTIAAQKFQSLGKDTDVFSPRVGVLYAITNNKTTEELNRMVDEFCNEKRVFTFRGAKVCIEFEGCVFDKANGFLCTIIEMQSFLG